MAKLKVVITDITSPRISNQWVVQEVIYSKTNFDLIRIVLKKRYIFRKVVLHPT